MSSCILDDTAISHDFGSPMVCPTTIIRTMKTASSTRIQHIATATMVCYAPLTATERPFDHPHPLPPHHPKRDEILIWRPLALVNGQSYKSAIQRNATFQGIHHLEHVF